MKSLCCCGLGCNLFEKYLLDLLWKREGNPCPNPFCISIYHPPLINYNIIMPIEASESYESLHLHLEVISDVETVESSLGPKPFRCFRFFRLQKLFCWRIICCCSSRTKDGKISQKMSRKEDLMEDFG